MTSRRTLTSAIPLVLLAAALSAVPTSAFAQKKKPAQKNQTKGTTQVAGAYVKFGEIYTLANGFNFQILKARYTMDSFNCYNGANSSATEKLLVIDYAVKNWTKDDKDFGFGGNFMVMDATGAKYYGTTQLKSRGRQEFSQILKPGQGLGQTALNDPLRIAFVLPLDADITKVMINEPRLGQKEQVLRYLLAGTDKEADPANVITPLPPEVRDPESKSGAVAKKLGSGKIGAPLQNGPFTYVVQKVENVTSALSDKITPEDGKRFVMVTMTIHNDTLKTLDYYGSQPRNCFIRDEDGEKSPPINFLKPSKPETAEYSEIDPGESVTIRVLFQVGASAKIKDLVIAGDFYPWRIENPGM